ncbi:MAG: hypothetical protein J0I12_25530 [Candidatus Eremiobacteraeota bacterium]|nr:hypothetical protein [Candidatus Eremiobacteraeota bacterium]
MGVSPRLSALQSDFLQSWFRLSQEFFLTGGGALIGFYGLPRTTQDLDLFTTSAQGFARVSDSFRDRCAALGATGSSMVTSPHFRRFRVEREGQVTLVDFVEDLAPQVFAQRMVRSDGVDLHFLATAGFSPDEALRLASQKDGGVHAESLAMILQSVPWEQFRLPGLDTVEVVGFFRAWLDRLTLGLHPG